jgi:hypothetical protein
LKFQGEVWAGRACAGTNQQELPTCTKSGGWEEKKFKKNGNCPTGPGADLRLVASPRPPTGGRQPLVGAWSHGHDWAPTVGRRHRGNQRSPPTGRRPKASRRLVVARRLRVDTCTYGTIHIFLKFFNLKKKNFWKFGRWAWAFGRMGVQHPHFLKLAPTLGSANSSKIHGEWRFHFFP